MKKYLDEIGEAVPRVLEIASEYELRGNPDCLLLYGYYEWGPPWWGKVLLGVRNGAGLHNRHKSQGPRGGS